MSRKISNQIYFDVRNRYAAIAQDNLSCCADSATCCSNQIYDFQSLESIPDGSDMGLGCGNPFEVASLKPGEVVLDLGSGGGIDVFIAADKVGKTGRVIGVDMTPEMVYKGRQNQKKGDYPQVEFRLGEIEHLPVMNGSVDVIISNCVINLSPAKAQVFREAMRVLKPGGRLAISDIVKIFEFPTEITEDDKYYTACITGAIWIDDMRRIMEQIGFINIQIVQMGVSSDHIDGWVSDENLKEGRFKLSNYVKSASIQAEKPEISNLED